MHKAELQRWGEILLQTASFIIRLIASLEFFTIRETVVRVIGQWLTRPITVGTISFSARDVLLFLIILFGGLIFSRLVRFVLQEELLGRLPLRQGMPHAISTTVFYVLILVGFLLSLAAIGVELTKFTILTGAFGIGVGFGLQNIVNNFISGMILLFELPIRLNDIIEMDGVEGFGESSLNFEARYWIMQDDNYFSIQTEIVVAITKALKGAGIEVPSGGSSFHRPPAWAS